MIRRFLNFIDDDGVYARVITAAAVVAVIADVAGMKPMPTGGLWIAVALLWWRQVPK